MSYYDIIVRKRDGMVLNKAELEYLVEGISNGSMPDYQISAWAMAVFFRGMNEEETRDFSLAMAHSGDIIDLSAIEGIKVDKHSTGGVGDKTTMVVIPVVAAAGVPAAKMSGRGLGHTGGTIDKFESIPGFKVEKSRREFIKQVNDIKCAVVSQSGNLVPADKRLYALRDVSATVESIPLIASSIMSKKLASGADGIVLDVKVGRGAFMKKTEQARQLARAMVEIGKGAQKRVVAILSDMDQPLGKMVGNALEVKEVIDTLRGKGPQDLVELSLYLAAHMLVLGGKAFNLNEALKMARDILFSGQALEKFMEMVAAQEGILDYKWPCYGLPVASHSKAIEAKSTGYVFSLNALEVGRAAMHLGAGRGKLEDIIDHAVGVELIKKCGDFVKAGEELAIIYYNDKARLDLAGEILAGAYDIQDEPLGEKPVIIEIIQ